MNIDHLLYTPERRLRAPWRLTLFVVALAAGLLTGAVIEGMVVNAAAAFGYRLLLANWSAPLGLLLATFAMLHWVDRLSWDYVGMGRGAARPRAIAGGAMIGILAVGVPSALLLLAGQLRIMPADPGSWWGAAGLATGSLLPAAFAEELLLRGYPFAVLRQSIGWRWTLVATSIVFGLLHVANPGSDAQSVLTVMLAGFFLGALFIASGSLYVVTAAHFGWNWIMAAALHSPVSGIPLPAPDYRVVDDGPDWLTGGGWGPEGGFAAAVSMFVVISYLYARHLRRMEQKG